MRPTTVLEASPPDCGHLFLLGTPRWKAAPLDSLQVLEWRSDTALLGMIASKPDWQSREELATLIRPNVEPARAKAYLRGLLHRLRTQIPGLSCLEVETDRVRWTGACDVREFHQAIDAADWKRAIGLHVESLAHNVRPCGVSAIDDWYFDERMRIEHRLQAALRAEVLRLRSPLIDSVDLMQQLARDEWLDEATIRFLLSNAKTPSERHLVAAAYTRYSQILSEESGHHPPTDLQEAYRGVLSKPTDNSAGQAVIAQQALTERPGEMAASAKPSQPSRYRLLGRDRDLESLARLLATPGVRLVNLHGLGGIGKTRLAREVLEKLQTTSNLEIAWVSLQDSNVATEGLLTVLRRHLGQPASESDGGDEWIQHRLSAGPKLIFLDGLTTTPAVQEELTKLLTLSSDLRFVVTSRMTLGLPEEHRVTLRGLEYGGPNAPANRLFKEQAARFGTDTLSMSDDVVDKVAAHLEGIPLAIELAASWTMLLTVQDIQAQLEKSASLLDSGLSVATDRTMASVVRSIWVSLTMQEKTALTGLAVHTGPIDFETALVLADTEPRVLLSLANYALLQRDGTGNLRVPLVLRQLIGATAEPETLHAAQHRHARYYLERLARGPAVKLGQTPRNQLIAIRKIFDEVVVAWRWALENDAIELLPAATENMLGFLFAESRFELARELAACTVDRLPQIHPLYPVYCAFHALGAFRLGRMEEATAATRKGLNSQPQGSALALLSLSASRLDRFYGRHDLALANAQAALDAAEHSDGYIQLRVREDFAVCHLTFGNAESAAHALQLNLAAARELDAPFVEGRALILLASTADAKSQYSQALDYYEKALAVFHGLGDGYQIAYCHRLASYTHANLGNADQQLREAQLALQGFRHGGHVHEISESLYAVALAQHRHGDLTTAFNNCTEALGMALKFQRIPSALRCIWALGMMLIPADPDTGMLAMHFAFHHPALRQIDRAFIEGHLRRMGIKLEEPASDIAHATPREITSIAQMLLTSDTQTKWGAAFLDVS